MRPLYAPPEAKALTDDEFCRLNPYGLNGRIGRLRYLTWWTVLLLIGAAATAFLLWFFLFIEGYVFYLFSSHYQDFIYHLDDIIQWLFWSLCSLIALTLSVFVFFFSAQRLHDLDFSGGYAALLLLPVINILLMASLLIIPGNHGHNTYGAPPPPNSLMVYWLAILWSVPLPFIALWLLGSLFRL